jgi:thiosulfate dehydrogenase
MNSFLKWLVFLCMFQSFSCIADQKPTMESLLNRAELDDYYSNVVFGYNIISNTQTYASRYVGNTLNCTYCHRGAGTVAGQLPLNVAGIYPHWRAKNAQLTSLGLKIRECFVYALNGIMPPANAPEIIAVKTYISYLSKNQIIGQSPVGRGISKLPDTGIDPNPTIGKIVYQQQCAVCHHVDGSGIAENPAVWGMQSYTAGSGMNNIQTAAAFIKTKMSLGDANLSIQQALDVSAFLHKQIRPVDPGKRKISKLLQDLAAAFGLTSKE